MSFARPNLSELIERARGDLESRLPGADARLRHSVLDVLARTHGGTAAGLYGYLDWLAAQLMPDTAEAEHLARWASIWGIRRKAAIAATATVQATGVDGSVIAAGTQMQRVDGAAYRTVAAATIAAGTADLAVEAAATGPGGDLTVGAKLNLSSAIIGVNAAVTVTEAGEAGFTEESDDDLLARLLSRIRTPPQGGAKSDYVAWALAQPGVTRAWAYPGWMGAGTVGVAFVMDGRDDILPLEADVAAVQAAIEELRPVTAELIVFAPAAQPIDVVIRVAPDTPEIRASIEAELADMFTRDAEPGGTIHVSRLREAISLSPGEHNHQLDLPDRDQTVAAGTIPMLGEVTFV